MYAATIASERRCVHTALNCQIHGFYDRVLAIIWSGQAREKKARTLQIPVSIPPQLLESQACDVGNSLEAFDFGGIHA